MHTVRVACSAVLQHVHALAVLPEQLADPVRTEALRPVNSTCASTLCECIWQATGNDSALWPFPT